ncbi:MAG TPA: PVC-type heme-binding CxxCH protein [Gemmataceae bacterium]|nr:PVC-type heme-binding CxxCH protein [Gemmataceae bacterium]
MANSLFAQRDAKVPDPDPELERKTLQVADGFEVNLFAADPLLLKPIQMNFDSAGRLWVSCSESYPQIKPGQKANDKIIILEDRDGDGKADKTIVFADGLLIPTGLEPGDGGVYVGASTDLLHLSRPNGEKGPLRRRVILSGFGTEDTHHLVHTLRWGHDGMLYFNQSIYIHSHIETPYGPRRLGGGGVWQFRPETRRLEVFARGWWNPWGHHFDRWGQSFVTDGAGTEGVNPVIVGASYTATPRASRVLQGLNPGHPKYCGCEILSGRHLPEEWRGSLITNDFRGHRVCRFTLAPEGSFYTATLQSDLIRSNHPAFRPVDVKMGPDGAIYIADWYNPIIQHGEVDFRDPRRDVSHGRIWRITAKGRPLVTRPRLVGAKTAELLEALKAPEQWTRHHARRVLKERGASVLPELKAWTAKVNTSSAGAEPLLLEALWTYQSLDVVEPQLQKTLLTLLRANDYRIRAAAVRFVAAWPDRLDRPLDLLAPRVADEHPQVRLEAVRALGQIPDVRAAELALQALSKPMDRYLEYGLWLTMRELEPHWLPALQAGRFAAGNSQQLLFALQAADSRAVLRPLVELVRSGKAGASETSVLAFIATLGGPQELSLLLDRIVAGSSRPITERTRLLEALEQATRQRNVRPAGDLARLLPLLKEDNEGLLTIAARVAGLWKLEAARPRLLELARADITSDAVRLAAVDGLATLGGKSSIEALEKLAGEAGPMVRRRLALIALVRLDARAAAGRAPAVLASLRNNDEAAAVFVAFLQRKGGVALLAAALRDRKLPADIARIGVRAVRSTGRPDEGLTEALTKAGDLKFGARTLSPKELQAMVADVAQKGNAARGEVVFRRKDQVCFKCHAIGGAGGQVGPDLSSIGGSAQVDYLIESLLQPNKAVKENYHALLVTTTKGQQYTGIKVRETKTELVLRDAEDKEIAIPIRNIDERTQGGSLMPDGLADTLTRGELLDLVRFLSELGKVGPYAVGPQRVVRRWQALEPTREAWGFLHLGGGLSTPAKNVRGLQWNPLYSTVSGVLPLTDAPSFALGKGKHTVSLIRCHVDVTTAGPFLVRLNPTKGLKLWVDQNPIAVKETLEVSLPVGVHTLTFVVDRDERREGLRCELADKPGSPARVRVVGGK